MPKDFIDVRPDRKSYRDSEIFETHSYWNVFYHCPYCGANMAGGPSFFLDADGNLKADAACSSCSKPVYRDERFFLNVSNGIIYYNPDTGEYRKPPVPRTEQSQWKVLGPVDHSFNIRYLSGRGGTEHHMNDDCDKQINSVFSALKGIAEKRQEVAAMERFDSFMAACEAAPMPIGSNSNAFIKSDIESLKQYIGHLVSIETGVLAVEHRLRELYALSQKNALKRDLSAHLILTARKQELSKAINDLYYSWNTIERRTVTLDRDEYVPAKPAEPEPPVLQTPGLFNRNKIEEENRQLMRRYEDELREYADELSAYNSAEAEYEAELAQLNQSADEEYYKAVAKVKAEAKKAVDRAAAEMRYAEEHMDDIAATEAAEKALLEQEIHSAEDTIKKLIAAKNKLYSFNVIFGKYRNLVALSSFYEYLMSGRCISLEGPGGAYNIYETEIRANQIISQLSDVVNSLEQIKNNQYMAYSQLHEMNVTLARLESKTERAITSLEHIEASGQTLENYMRRVAANSDVIAYNTEKTAYYAKKNKELTDALGFMVALK